MDHNDENTADSTDAKVTHDLIETLIDGSKGYETLAEKMSDDDRADLVTFMRKEAAAREGMAEDLRIIAAQYGDVVDSDGSTSAAVHRGWMSVKDAVTGNDPKGALEAALKGEEHAISEYEDALQEGVSSQLRSKIQQQLESIRSAQHQLESLAASS